MSYIFVFSPNNSGSTVTSQYLASQCDGYLPPFGENHEGQFAPTVRHIMRNNPWSADEKFDWNFIKQEWDVLLERSGKNVFVEASPPNMIRVPEILETFGQDLKGIFTIANPYLHIGSCIYNYQRAPMTAGMIVQFTSAWLKKATLLRRLSEQYPQIPQTTYELFCRHPAHLNVLLGLPVVEIKRVPGKHTAGETIIRDMTAATATFLKADELDLVSELLQEDPEVIEYFGYVPEEGKDLINRAAKSPELFERGLARRENWEQRSR